MYYFGGSLKLKIMEQAKTLSVEHFKKGFRYLAWVGYEWTEVEYPKTGFSKSQLQAAIDKKIVKHLN